MNDTIETIGRSIIQHGANNDRVYLMKLHPEDDPDIIARMDRLATEHGYTKIFAKVPRWSMVNFIGAGYELEASIPSFFPDNVAACFVGKYFNEARRAEHQALLLKKVLDVSRVQEPVCFAVQLPEDFNARVASEADVAAMAALYSEVFASYPFPIHDPNFLRASMFSGTVYFGIWKGEEIVALASAEVDPASGSAEMTDFATLPDYRGHGFALYLLQQLEETMRARGIRSLFTIARAYSFGMNITFARSGYRYGGTLTNNTNISGRLESMNVWHKSLMFPPAVSEDYSGEAHGISFR